MSLDLPAIPPHIKWTYTKKEKNFNGGHNEVPLQALLVFIGKCSTEYLLRVNQIAELREEAKPSYEANDKFKGLLLLRSAPFFLLFSQRQSRQGLRKTPVVYDNHFIHKWTGGLCNIRKLNSRVLLYPLMRGKFTPPDIFLPLLDKWIQANLDDYFKRKIYGTPRQLAKGK